MSNKNTTPASIEITPAYDNYISIDLSSKRNMSLYEMAVYQTLRFECQFSQKVSKIERTIAWIAKESKCSERKVYDALNALEFKHFVLQRQNVKNFKYGKVNSYLIAKDYEYFKQKDQSFYTPASNDIGVKQENKLPEQISYTPAPYAGTPARNDILRSTLDIHKKNKTINNTLSPPDGDVLPVKAVDTDYSYPDTLYQESMPATEIKNKELNAIVSTNPHNIPCDMIEDWAQVRKVARKKITRTAWNTINKQLELCKQKGISPLTAFETMVTRGWASIEVDWLTKGSKTHLAPDVTYFNHDPLKPLNIAEDLF